MGIPKSWCIPSGYTTYTCVSRRLHYCPLRVFTCCGSTRDVRRSLYDSYHPRCTLPLSLLLDIILYKYPCILLYYIDIDLQESANGNNPASMLWFSLTAHWSMCSSSFALNLQTPEIVHSEGTEYDGVLGPVKKINSFAVTRLKSTRRL